MQITDKAKEQQIMPLFRLAFRPFFLGASIFSVIAMTVWGLFWSGIIDATATHIMYGAPIWWHSHEMMFGFAGAAIVGFLLTAVQNWTGQIGTKGIKLATLFGLWVLARVGLLLGSVSYIWLVIDTAWILLAGYFLVIPIIKVKQWRNLCFAPLLLIFAILNVYHHLMVLQVLPYNAQRIALAVVTVIAIFVVLMGGRVIPFFTSRGTQTSVIKRNKLIEFAALIPVWLLLVATLFPAIATKSMVGYLCFIAAITNLIRFSRWRPLTTLHVPLLWSLHGAYLAVIIGFALLGGSYLSTMIPPSISLHMITIGGVGSMIIAMMARVSLGHTGRKLLVNRWMSIAFLALFCAVIIRTLLLLALPQLTINAYVFSAALWVIAFVIFSIVYYSILTQPRVDGHPG